MKQINTYSKPSQKKNLIQKAGFRIWNPYLTELTAEYIYKIINGVIPKEEHKGKHKFFKKHATHLFLQIFYSYTDNTEIKGFFTCLKDKHEKNILGLGNMEISKNQK